MSLDLPDDATAADLATFVLRARRLDPDGAVRLVAGGGVLTVTAAALHGSGGPTVLGMRAIAASGEADVTLPLTALVDALGAVRNLRQEPLRLEVPGAATVAAGWVGVLPPRRGWETVGVVDQDLLSAAARQGIAEVAAGSPAGSGSAAVARLRAAVWGRPIQGLPGVPAGGAFAADAFGFLGADVVTLHRTGPWTRLTSTRGHVVARSPLLRV